MKPIFFSTESQAPASAMIMECFLSIARNMQVKSLSKYTDHLDIITIIPFCLDEEYMEILQMKERKYISWKSRSADIRLQIDFNDFIHASIDERMYKCKEHIIYSLQIIKKRCEAKKIRFDIDDLIHDIFPNDQLK